MLKRNIYNQFTMFGMFQMSEERKALLAHKNWVSFRNMHDNQLRKYSSTTITVLKIGFTKQKIVLLLDAMYKLASFSGGFIYRDLTNNKKLYEIVGEDLDSILQNMIYFPTYDEFQAQCNLIIEKIFRRLIGTDDTFRNEIHG